MLLCFNDQLMIPADYVFLIILYIKLMKLFTLMNDKYCLFYEAEKHARFVFFFSKKKKNEIHFIRQVLFINCHFLNLIFEE